MQKWQIDLKDYSNTPSLGCNWMLAVIGNEIASCPDCFSKFLWLFPIPRKEAHFVFESLLYLIDFLGTGPPESIQCVILFLNYVGSWNRIKKPDYSVATGSL